MNAESIAAAIIGILMVALLTTLLIKKRVNQPSYIILLSLTSLVCIVLHGFPRLKELDVKSLRLTLTEMKQVRTEVYVKAETVARLSERVVDLIIRSTRSAPFASIEKLEADAMALLEEANSAPELRESTRRRFALVKARNLLSHLYFIAETDDDEIPDELTEPDTYNRQAAELWCIQNKIDMTRVIPLLNEIDNQLNIVRTIADKPK